MGTRCIYRSQRFNFTYYNFTVQILAQEYSRFPVYCRLEMSDQKHICLPDFYEHNLAIEGHFQSRLNDLSTDCCHTQDSLLGLSDEAYSSLNAFKATLLYKRAANISGESKSIKLFGLHTKVIFKKNNVEMLCKLIR